MIVNHWLWPTLIMDTRLAVDDIGAFNVRLLKSRTTDTSDYELLRSTVVDVGEKWLSEVGLTEKMAIGQVSFDPMIYSPGQYVTPHYHGPLELVGLYYASDENDAPQRQITPIDDSKHTMSRKHGHTSLHDPRNAFELRPNPVVEFKPEQGRLLVFPGYVLHWSLPTNKPRMVISVRIEVVEK